MKKLFIYFLVVSLLSTVSCNKEEDEGKLSGKPNKISCNDNINVHLSYQGDRLLQITENGSGSTTKFHYENGELSSISSSPTDPKIADGNSFVRFKKEDNRKIIAESGGEPAVDVVRIREIELDANDFPVKITNIGEYSVGEGGVRTKTREGEYYVLFSWDISTKQLLKEETIHIETAQVVATYTYKYDNAPGVMSMVDWPLWFYADWNNRHHYALGTYRALFFGYSNNLVEVTINDDLNERHEVVKYVYDYSLDGFPVSASVHASGMDTSTIQIKY